MAVLKRVVLALLVLAFLAGSGVAAYYARMAWLEDQFLNTPSQVPGQDVTVVIEPGESFHSILKQLKDKGLVTDSRRFLKLAITSGLSSKVRAGEFVLNTGWLPEKILTQLTSTSGVLRKLSVREGLTWWQTARLAQEAGLGDYDSFERAVHNATLLARYGIKAENAEGYLFPETYLLTRPVNGDAQVVVEAMLSQFNKAAQKTWPVGPPNATRMHEFVTLASLVEKETGDISERERITGVFANRLRRGMLLQADPTIIYGLGPEFDGNLRKKHLTDRSNPYNSYRFPGLPPGPICSPGLESLKAANNPESHKFLYFVAKGNGSHHFSKNLKEHNKAVERYQLRRNRKTYRSYSKD